MKTFLSALAIVAALALGWNYLVMHRQAGAPRGAGNGAAGSGTYFSRGPNGGFGLPSGPTTSISGIVRMAGGVSHGAHVDLVRVSPTGPSRVYAGQEAVGDGRFTFPRVAADRYWVVARTDVDVDPMRPGEGPVQTFFGTAEIVSDGEHPGHVGVALYPASTVAGRVTLAPLPSSAARDFGLLSVSLTPIDPETRAATATVEASSDLTVDGEFSLSDVPAGRYALQLSGSSWTLDTVTVAGHDRLDLPFQIGPGERLTASVILTEHANELVGTLRDGAGHPAALALVAAFAVDPDQREAHRRVQFVRTDETGTFQFDGLPSGDYLVAPAAGFEPTVWGTPAFFARLTPVAAHVTLHWGQRRALDLRTPESR